MVGSDPLSLPSGVAININTNNVYGAALPPAVNGNIDILFSPTGAVISPGMAAQDIKLWLIDTTQPGTGSPNTFNGDQFIVTIAARTGLISIHPVDVTPKVGSSPAQYQNPYSFTQDGRSSGF